METYIMEILLIMKNLEKDNINFLLEIIILELSKRIKDVDMENWFFQMVIHMKVIGKQA